MLPNLYDILEKVFQVPKTKISDDLSQKSIESWDSMSHLILITELEEAFSLQFSEEEIIAMKTVGDVKKILKTYGLVF